jgi:hypothetical protein
MTTLQLILLSILSGIYLERGRQWVKSRIRIARVRDMLSKMNYVYKEDDKRRVHAMEDNIHFKFPEKEGDKVIVPFGGGHVTIERLADDQPPSLEDQLKDALEHEEFERAAVLRDKMKER